MSYHTTTQFGTTIYELSIQEQQQRNAQIQMLLGYIALQGAMGSVQQYNAAGGAIRYPGATTAAPGYESVPSDFSPFNLLSNGNAGNVGGEVAGNNTSQSYLNSALKQQGLKNAPNGLKQTWIEDGYKYEVRVHPGETQYTNAGSIYRVSRQQIPTPGTQGTGTYYLGTDGNWYHTSVLRQFNADGSLNPIYNANAAQHTPIPLP